MSVSIYVGHIGYPIGAPSFLNAFFSTVALRLEDGHWGSRFPRLMHDLYAGHLVGVSATDARSELSAIRRLLRERPVSEIVWDAEDPSAQPPWGDNVSDDITNLAEYFVTTEGLPLLDVLDDALAHAERSRLDVRVQ